jgi:DUF4097 and DUF4098 domain-containing protein YvlB
MSLAGTTRSALWWVVSLAMLAAPALAQCPIPAGATLFLKAPLGNLVVDTSGTDRVEVQVSFAGIEVVENCFADRVEISGVAPERVYQDVDWNIRVPASASLNLVTLAGSIRIQNTRGNVTARTEGGTVTVGDIGGSADITTRAGAIMIGNIAGTAELRSLGGEIRVGRIGGNAELTTGAGPITSGAVSGSVRAETAGGNISLEGVGGNLIADTLAGDIAVGAVGGRVEAQTGGGNIAVASVRGPFRGFTDLGNIRIGQAAASIEATSGSGDVEADLRPESFEGDLHVKLEANAGDARLSMPGNMPATLEAVVDRSSVREPRLRSDFRLEATRERRVPEALGPRFAAAPSVFVGEINGGGHAIQLRASGGFVEIVGRRP